jgi:hypothetical protein
MRSSVTDALSPGSARALVQQRFDDAQLDIVDLSVRQYPDEAVFIVLVNESDLPRAAALGNELDLALAEGGLAGFVTVRSAPAEKAVGAAGALKMGVHEARATELIQLVSARSRTSEIQPSLSYVRDAAANIAVAVAPRHHLVFGRRGAGKTSLLVEAKRLVEADGHLTAWMNLQTYRFEPANRVFLWAARKLVDLIEVELQNERRATQLGALAAKVGDNLDALLADPHPPDSNVRRVIPELQSLIRRFIEAQARRVYIFLDDFHYLPRADQPLVLDMIHGLVRDTDAWMKIAAIKHLSRWFQSPPPLGLQTGHDADHIELDLSLEDPLRAKAFLEEVLQRYANQAGIRSLAGLFSPDALNRLVLASGAVPRDFLVLSAASVTRARTRQNARLVGVQDVNNAAGDAAQVKIRELEDDFAAEEGSTGATLDGLDVVRGFCLDHKRWTYFRVDFKDKERSKEEYEILTNLLEARLVHLISGGVSDTHRAGERSEVFMLDLSQFSGQRLKKHIRVLDFVAGHLVSRETGTGGGAQVGDTARRLVTILRRAPTFDLDWLARPIN